MIEGGCCVCSTLSQRSAKDDQLANDIVMLLATVRINLHAPNMCGLPLDVNHDNECD